MIVLDASVLIAHLDSRDPHHAQALACFRNHAADAFAMHTSTLTESFVGPVRAGRSAAAEKAVEMLGIEEWTPPAGTAPRLARLRVETGLRLPDCCVLDAAIELGAEIASFDARLVREARRLGIRSVTSAG